VIEGLIVTPLNHIEVDGGDVLHAMKVDDAGACGFGEAYFSEILPGSVKAWKRHKAMTLNLVVPIGAIKFVVMDDRNEDQISFEEIILSRDNYCRLTVPPMVWMGFQCVHSSTSILLNIASIKHDPIEANKKAISEINYKW
jgi:dTDP-4-dehydrorhamnose 3,5-epimerase